MVAEQILQRLEAEFDNPPDQIRAVADLLEAGASPEFIAMFRRDETGDPGEERITAIAERQQFLTELETRKATVLQQAAERGHDAEALASLLANSVDQDLLDDVDHFLRPHEHKAQAQVERLGLGPLVEGIHTHALGDRTPQQAAATHVREGEEGVADADQVLAQVVLALAERYGEDPGLRTRVRVELSRGILTASAGIAAPSREPQERPAPAAEPKPAAEAPPAETEADQEAAPTAEPEAATPTAETGEPIAPETPPGSEAEQIAPDVAEAEPAAETEPSTEAPPPEAEAADQEAAPTAEPEAATPAEETGEPSAPETPPSNEAEEAAGEATMPSTETPAQEQARSAPAQTDTPPPAKRQRERRDRGGKKGAGRYRQYFGLEEPVRRIPASRMLALRHAEREGILQLRLVLPGGRELELFRERFSPDVDPQSPLGRFLDLVYGHAYDIYVHRPCEQTVRHNIKDRADRETVRAFARSLRSQLMSPVVEDAPVAAMRVSGKAACLAIIDVDGSTKARMTLPIPDGEEARAELIATLAGALRESPPRALAIPHGRREPAAKRLVREVLAALTDVPHPLVVPVDETAAVVWATSPQARRRHSQSDTGMRTTLSLARRLRDPLFELMRVEPRGLGLGQNLTEVHQGMLKRQLDAALTSCLAHIGIDINRADPALLARAPGVGRDLAKAITQDRAANRPFKTLSELTRVQAVDDATFVRIAGFLRVRGGEDPFDATGVPPENRVLVTRIATREGVEPAELVGRNLRHLDPREFVDEEEFGFLRVRDTFDALRRGAHDARGQLEAFSNDGVARFDDLQVDRELRGRVTNLAEFGAFVDLGVGQDGLVHVSQIPGSRLRDPMRVLRVGEVVRVYVVHLDPSGRKIGLSMIKPRHMAEGRPATLGERMGGGGRRGAGGRRGREEPPVMNRAARAPEGRRGPRRGPRPPRPKTSEHMEEARGMDARRGRGPRGGPPGAPRVFTIESDKVQEAQRGHKGELRSLSGLRSLLPSDPRPEGEEEHKPKDD